MVERKLVINEREAALVRDIFRRYGEHGSAAQLRANWSSKGTTKAWVTQTGRRTLGPHHRPTVPRSRCCATVSTSAKFLSTEWYRVARGHRFPKGPCGTLYAFIERRKQAPREHRAKHPALLAGLLFALTGNACCTPSSRKERTAYRYVPYLHKRRNAGASLSPAYGTWAICPPPRSRCRAGAKSCCTRLRKMLIAVWRSCQQHPAVATLDEARVVVAMQRIGDVVGNCLPNSNGHGC